MPIFFAEVLIASTVKAKRSNSVFYNSSLSSINM